MNLVCDFFPSYMYKTLKKEVVQAVTHHMRFIFGCYMPALIKENNVNYLILQVVK